jgi:hypothetical protein
VPFKILIYGKANNCPDTSWALSLKMKSFCYSCPAAIIPLFFKNVIWDNIVKKLLNLCSQDAKNALEGRPFLSIFLLSCSLLGNFYHITPNTHSPPKAYALTFHHIRSHRQGIHTHLSPYTHSPSKAYAVTFHYIRTHFPRHTHSPFTTYAPTFQGIRTHLS